MKTPAFEALLNDVRISLLHMEMGGNVHLPNVQQYNDRSKKMSREPQMEEKFFYLSPTQLSVSLLTQPNNFKVGSSLIHLAERFMFLESVFKTM